MHSAAIYLDYNATSPLDPEVLEAMQPLFLTGGNAESRHAWGRSARRAWEQARGSVASILGADPGEVIFTSGGTEANNLAVFGLAGAENSPGHVITTPIEHPAVVEPIARLEAAGFTVECLSVDGDGLVDLSTAPASVRPDTRFASLMLANNETGAIQPVQDLAALVAEHGIPVHTDAIQAVGRIPVNFHKLGVATLAASAHKFHGPMGVGLLLVRQGIKLGSRLFGGGQQQGRRAGTVAVPLVVGLATALEKWHQTSAARAVRWMALRDRLESGLVAALGSGRVFRNGPVDDGRRLPQTLNLGFPGVNGDLLLMQLDMVGVGVSLGSACASGSTRPSPTLVAMRVPEDRLRSSVRFSMGANTTEAEIDEAVVRIACVVQRLGQAEVGSMLPASTAVLDPVS
jgi:cysteine desulfurase